MQVTLEIPDDMVDWLTASGRNLSRAAVEAPAVEGYRTGPLTPLQTRLMLGLEIRYDLDQFPKGTSGLGIRL